MRISPDRMETLKAFESTEGHLEDEDFYFVAVETLFPRTILFYEVDSSGLELLLKDTDEAVNGIGSSVTLGRVTAEPVEVGQ